MAGRMGSPKGKVGSVSPFFPLVQSFFLSPFLTLKHTHNPVFQIYLIHMYNYSVSLSLVSTTLLPHPLSTLGSVETPALPHQRCQKWGHNFWTEDLGHAPCLPPPAPPDGFITSYAAHLKPIESLGGRECLTQISTSEGVSATLGNC